MGNCQAVDAAAAAAALVIQHPNGKIERMYCSITATEVMKINPGHYVSLIVPLIPSHPQFTRLKLLRPTDTLVLGRAYRLVTTTEVIKVLRAKKHAKMMKKPPESMADGETETSSGGDQCETAVDNSNQVEGHERMFRQRSGSSSSILAASRSKSWRPSLQSISEATI